MTSPSRRSLPAFAYLLVGLVVLLWVWQHTATVTLDDAYITYRYADNLAQHGRLFYNETGPAQSFATTAPAYAVLLAGLRWVGLDIPAAGGWLSVLAMIVAAIALVDLLAGWFPWGGVVAGLLLAVFPMSWLVLGMEGLPSLALVLVGFALSRRRHDVWAAVALAAATLLRFDAAAAALAWGGWLLLRDGWRSRGVWRAAAVYLAGVVAAYAALMLFLGVPLPSTLGSKRAQVSLGITGFFSDTSYLEGLWLLVRAYWQQSPWYAILAFLALVGLVDVLIPLRDAEGRAAFRSSPFLVLMLWTLAHLGLYVTLGVTPYVWYYLPVAPLLAALASRGIFFLAPLLMKTRLPFVRDFALPALVILALLGPFATHRLIDARVLAAAKGAPTAPQTLADKALPGTQYPAYRRAGEWLAANTPVTATVGVTEVGIMGYFSKRPMVDFLGLLDGAVSDALGRGDMSWAMYARQPDFVALSDLNPAYAYNAYQDPWFRAAYRPEQTVPANGFWGGDMTIYRRTPGLQPQGDLDSLPASAEPTQIRFGGAFELAGFEAPPGPWRGGDPAATTFYWRVLDPPTRDYKLFVHLVDGDGRIVATRDQAPLLGERPASQWRAGELLADFQPLGLPPLPVAPANLTWEVGFYDPKTGERLPAFGPDGSEMPGGQARFGARELLPATQPVVLGANDCAVEFSGYRLDAPSVARGGETRLAVDLSGVTCPISLTADIWDWAGNRPVWEQTIEVTGPGAVEYTIVAAPGDPATWPGLRVRAESAGQKLYQLDDAGHPLADTLNLTPIGLTGP